MRAPQHTFGTWRRDNYVKDEKGRTFILAGSIEARVQRDPPSGCAVVVAVVKHDDDVPLIEAAPQLLAELIAARDFLKVWNTNDDMRWNERIANVSAVIAKAQGGAL